MKLKACTVLLFLCLLAVVRGAQPTDESIERMMYAMHVDKTLDQILMQLDGGIQTGLREAVQGALKGREMNATQKEEVTKFVTKVRATLREDLSFSKMKGTYIQAYRETLTQDDVNNLTNFYTSPAGKSVVDKIPAAMQKAGILMQPQIGPAMVKVQGMIQVFARDVANMK